MFFVNEDMSETFLENSLPSTSRLQQLDMAQIPPEYSLPSRSLLQQVEMSGSPVENFLSSTSQLQQLGSSEAPLQTFLPSTSGLQQTHFVPLATRPSTQYDSDDSEHDVTNPDKSLYPFLSNNYEKLDQYGHISGVKPGTMFKSRKVLRECGVHRSHSICCFREEGLISIILHDYLLITDEGSIILLSGYNKSGGTQNSTKHFELVNALQENEKSKMPVRVVRSNYFRRCPSAFRPKKGYRYDGIYEVIHAEYIEQSFCSILKRIVDHNQPPIPELTAATDSPVSQLCDTLCYRRDKQLDKNLLESYYQEEDVKNVIVAEGDCETESTNNFKSEELDCFEDTSSELDHDRNEDDDVEFSFGKTVVFAEPPDLKYTPPKVENISPSETDGIFLITEKNSYEIITPDKPEEVKEFRENKGFYAGYKYNFRENNSDCKSFKNEFMNNFEKKKPYNLIDLPKQCDEANDFYNMDPKCRHSPVEDPLKISSPDEGKPHDCIYNLTLKKLFERLVGTLFKICPCLLSREMRPMSEDFEEYLEYIFQNPGKIIPPYKFERKFMRQLKRIKKKKTSDENNEKSTPKLKKANQKQFVSKAERDILTKSKQTSNPDEENRSSQPDLYTVAVNRPPSTQSGEERTSALLNNPSEKTSSNHAKTSCQENSTSLKNYRIRSRGLSSSQLSNRTPGRTVKRVKRRKKFRGQRELESLGTPNCTIDYSQELPYPRRSPRRRCKLLINEGPLIVSGIEPMDFEGFTDEEILRAEKHFKFFTDKERPFKGFSSSSEGEKYDTGEETVSVPKPVTTAEPNSGFEPISEPQPISRVELNSELEQISEPQPISRVEPNSELEQISEPQPISRVEPNSELEQISEPQPISRVEPNSELEQISEPQPISRVEPNSELQPVSGLQPISMVEPDSGLGPIAGPQPISRIEPNPGFRRISGMENYVEDIDL